MPLFGFVFLVALGIDYSIFLMTRVREECRSGGHPTGLLVGLAVTGGVITSAGVVLAATFAALGVIPILFLAQIAFIVAFGVLLDTSSSGRCSSRRSPTARRARSGAPSKLARAGQPDPAELRTRARPDDLDHVHDVLHGRLRACRDTPRSPVMSIVGAGPNRGSRRGSMRSSTAPRCRARPCTRPRRAAR